MKKHFIIKTICIFSIIMTASTADAFDYSVDYPDYSASGAYSAYDYSIDYPEYDFSIDQPVYDYSIDYPEYDFSIDQPVYDYTVDYPDYSYNATYPGVVSIQEYDYPNINDIYVDAGYGSYYSGYYGGSYYPSYSYDIPNYSYDYGDYYVPSTPASPSLAYYSSGNNTIARRNNDDLEVQCEVSDSRIEEGDRVTIEVDIDGGDGPYDIQWSGDDDEIDDFDDNDRSQRVRIDDEGTYRLRVTVEDDDGNRDSDTCTIRVGEDDGDINVLSNTDGQLAGLSSVYLNQVPYTGPEDNLKIFGFISLILIWSALVAFYLLKDRQKKQVSNRIQAFKEANRAKLEA
jgi:hypothetical protein